MDIFLTVLFVLACIALPAYTMSMWSANTTFVAQAVLHASKPEKFNMPKSKPEETFHGILVMVSFAYIMGYIFIN